MAVRKPEKYEPSAPGLEGRVVCTHGGGHIGLAEVKTGAAHGGVRAGFEDVQWFHGYALRGGDAYSLGQRVAQDF